MRQEGTEDMPSRALAMATGPGHVEPTKTMAMERPAHRLKEAVHAMPTEAGKPTDAGKIVWTEIDEAPALATYSLLPVI